MSDNQGRTARRRGRRFLRLAATALSAAAVIAFAQEALPKGIGPVTAVELGEVDEGMAAAGRATLGPACKCSVISASKNRFSTASTISRRKLGSSTSASRATTGSRISSR